LLGITGKFTDRRDILSGAEANDEKCKLAVDMECYKLKKILGSYAAALGKVDAIVFTAGVGENSGDIRQKVLDNLDCLGIVIDKDKNLKSRSKDGETLISKPDSKIKVFVIPTNEELVFVEDVVGILNKTYDDHMVYKYTFLKK
jgi:acetate kinase